MELLWHQEVITLVCVRGEQDCSEMAAVLGVLLPPRAGFSWRGCTAHKAVWHDGMSEQSFRMQGLRGQYQRTRGAEGASLTHTICVHIGDSPGALNYVWAPYCRELQHIAQMLLLRSAALASHRRLQSTDRYCSFTAPHCPKSAFHPALHADLIYAVFL